MRIIQKKPLVRHASTNADLKEDLGQDDSALKAPEVKMLDYNMKSSAEELNDMISSTRIPQSMEGTTYRSFRADIGRCLRPSDSEDKLSKAKSYQTLKSTARNTSVQNAY
mmetsp:Transcript_24704/g.38453  ORF Transcript_24704/g.38453 Transcript_24704/m.38453 type:complete len:110 (+) Transcript_24704:2444-2773(+)|eukprot:CAMPEP_0170497942 /NCGR_PEP_ID=MMETSP0208-20121228/26295_1 /TAXON_ID=197538 /ORGANISM="Strombidium inclinatum, Strain S3" /LENGTH=109 /DNA_ID=CAMNT_0010774929 /DNA_START=2418 /DNA_END=2747 /DNA_ORIENTATION=+